MLYSELSHLSAPYAVFMFQVQARKQMTAFSPNFIHSLDGSHMMMTAVACNKAGLSFAGQL